MDAREKSELESDWDARARSSGRGSGANPWGHGQLGFMRGPMTLDDSHWDSSAFAMGSYSFPPPAVSESSGADLSFLNADDGHAPSSVQASATTATRTSEGADVHDALTAVLMESGRSFGPSEPAHGAHVAAGTSLDSLAHLDAGATPWSAAGDPTSPALEPLGSTSANAGTVFSSEPQGTMPPGTSTERGQFRTPGALNADLLEGGSSLPFHSSVAGFPDATGGDDAIPMATTATSSSEKGYDTHDARAEGGKEATDRKEQASGGRGSQGFLGSATSGSETSRSAPTNINGGMDSFTSHFRSMHLGTDGTGTGGDSNGNGTSGDAPAPLHPAGNPSVGGGAWGGFPMGPYSGFPAMTAAGGGSGGVYSGPAMSGGSTGAYRGLPTSSGSGGMLGAGPGGTGGMMMGPGGPMFLRPPPSHHGPGPLMVGPGAGPMGMADDGAMGSRSGGVGGGMGPSRHLNGMGGNGRGPGGAMPGMGGGMPWGLSGGSGGPGMPGGMHGGMMPPMGGFPPHGGPVGMHAMGMPFGSGMDNEWMGGNVHHGMNPMMDPSSGAYGGGRRFDGGMRRGGGRGGGGGPLMSDFSSRGHGRGHRGGGGGGGGGGAGGGGDGYGPDGSAGGRPRRGPPAGGGRGGGADGFDGGQQGAGRSALVESLYARLPEDRSGELEVKDMLGSIVDLARDPEGSRLLQEQLQVASDREKEQIFAELHPHVVELMLDVFGHFVIQKFFEHGTEEQKALLLDSLRGKVLQLSLHVYGCRVIQKALDGLDRDGRTALVDELRGHVSQCIQDQHGNHVIQKCIERVRGEGIQFVLDSFADSVYAVSTHPFGCRIVQRVLEFCIPEQTKPVLDQVLHASRDLMRDQFGNYVIQHLVEHGQPEHRSYIGSLIRGNLLSCCQHKFASNIVERCLEYGSREEQLAFIDEALSADSSGTVPLHAMMKDKFGNFVTQKMLDLASPEQRAKIISYLRSAATTLKRHQFGRHVIARLARQGEVIG